MHKEDSVYILIDMYLEALVKLELITDKQHIYFLERMKKDSLYSPSIDRLVKCFNINKLTKL